MPDLATTATRWRRGGRGLRRSRRVQSLRAKLPDRAEPVFHVVGLGDLAVLDGLDIDGHDPEALTGVRHPKYVARGRARDFAAHDYAIAGDQHFLDIEFHVGERGGEA